jgi:hypothetical protein
VSGREEIAPRRRIGRCIAQRGVAPPRHGACGHGVSGAPCAAGASAARLGPAIRSRPPSRRPGRSSAAAIALLVALAWATPARAYGFLRIPGAGGVTWRWDLGRVFEGRIPWRLAEVVGPQVVGDRTAEDVLLTAFARWEGLDESSWRFAYEGRTSRRGRDDDDGVHLLTLGSDEDLGQGVLAATFLSGTRDGVLTDVDIVFGRDVPFTTSDAPDGSRYDLESVAAHEIGHLVGLDHSGLVRATMAPFTDEGDVHQRTPERDDRVGAGLLAPEGDFLARTGTLAGRVTLEGTGVFLAHVVATRIDGEVAAGVTTSPDGAYRIEGLEPGTYLVHAERLDGPVGPGNVDSQRQGFGRSETDGYATTFH